VCSKCDNLHFGKCLGLRMLILRVMREMKVMNTTLVSPLGILGIQT